MNIGKMMKDLQKMQSKLMADMETLEVEGSAGGGVVAARMNGKKELLSLKLSPEAVTPDDLGLMAHPRPHLANSLHGPTVGETRKDRRGDGP